MPPPGDGETGTWCVGGSKNELLGLGFGTGGTTVGGGNCAAAAVTHNKRAVIAGKLKAYRFHKVVRGQSGSAPVALRFRYSIAILHISTEHTARARGASGTDAALADGAFRDQRRRVSDAEARADDALSTGRG